MIETEVCTVQSLLNYMEDFSENKMCGKCLPCMLGTNEALIILRKIIEGKGNLDDLSLLRLISTEVSEIARCKLGREMAQHLTESLNVEDEFIEHVEQKRCSRGTCADIVGYHIISDKCVMCGLCKSVCPEEAIIGEKYISYRADNKPFIIREQKCTKCGLCLAICEEHAIEIF